MRRTPSLMIATLSTTALLLAGCAGDGGTTSDATDAPAVSETATPLESQGSEGAEPQSGIPADSSAGAASPQPPVDGSEAPVQD